MGKEISRDDAVKMANWWAEQITHTGQNMGTKEQGGNEMANILGTLLACKAAPNEEQVERFKNKLVDIIIEKKVNSLEVDYNPDIYLFEAAKYANIDCNCFPWKSSTTIRSNGVIFAKRGYGEKAERI